MRLTLGCGAMLLSPPWVNVDAVRPPTVPDDYEFVCHDLRFPLPFPDESVELIHCAHCLDHLPLLSVLSLLRECQRVMQKGAVARFVVMDQAAILAVYREGRIDEFGYCQPPGWRAFKSHALKLGLFLMGSMSGRDDYTGHWWSADWEGVREIFQTAGIKGVRRMEFGQSQSQALQLEVPDNYPDHSLYVEFKK